MERSSPTGHRLAAATLAAAVGLSITLAAQGPACSSRAASRRAQRPVGGHSCASRPTKRRRSSSSTARSLSLRARVLGTSPERARGGRRRGRSTIWSPSGITGPVEMRAFEGGVLVSVGSRAVLGADAARYRRAVG